MIAVILLGCALFGFAAWQYFNRARTVVEPEALWPRLLKVGNVYDILVDPLDRSNVWFATGEGIRLYEKDTGRWRSYGLHDGLPSEQITSITADSSRVWFGTWSGVVYYERATGRWIRPKLGDRVRQRRVLDLEKDGPLLWVSSTEGGVERLDPQTGAWEKFGKEAGFTTGEVYSILATSEAVYAGSNQGTLYILDRKSGQWQPRTNPGASSFVVKIWALERDGEEIWMGTSHKGVWQYNTKSGTWRTHAQTGGTPLLLVYSVAVDSASVWAGTPLGIVRYSKKSDAWIAEVTTGFAGKPYVMASLANDEGYVWFGSYQQGLGKVLKDRPETIPYSGGLEHDYICAIGVDSASLWLGYGFLGDYTDRIRKDSLIWERNVNLWDGLPGENVSVIRCQKSNVFIGTWQGFAYFDARRSQWVSSSREFGFASEVKTALVDGESLYVGTENGLYVYVPGHGRLFLLEKTAGLSVLGIEAGGPDLWLATRTGLYRLQSSLGALSRIDTVGEEPVSGLAMIGDSLWLNLPSRGIGIYSKSRNRFSILEWKKTQLARRREEKKTLQAAGIKAMDGKIWIATNHGMAVFDPARDRDYAITFADGLINNDVLTIEADETNYYFGLFGGLNKVPKNSLAKSVFIP